MNFGRILLLLAFLLPLCLDTFVLSAALGIAGLAKKDRNRVSLVLAFFEGLMPAVGVLAGHSLAHVIGQYANYIAAAVIAITGLVMLKPEGEESEARRAKLLAQTRGLMVINLGLSISIDEVAAGFSLGLLHIPLLLAVVFLAGQAFIASWIGLRVGERLSAGTRENAEKLAGGILVLLGIVLAIIKATGHQI